MANLAKSDALWYRFWVRFFFVLGVFRCVDFLARRFGDEKRTLLAKIGDPKGNFGGTFTLDGVVIGTSTDERGRVYVRVTSGTNPRTVTVYKATGGGSGDRICAGTANAGALATMTALNSSGVTGTFLVDATVTADDDDEHAYFVQQDWRLHAANVFNGTDAEGEDARSRDSIGVAFNQIARALDDARTACVNLLFALLVSDEDNARAYGSKFMKERFTSLLTESFGPPDGTGRIAPVRTGALASLYQDMIDEATGSTQTVRRRFVAAAAATEEAGNDGQFAIASHTPEAQHPTGTIVLRAKNAKEEGFPTGVLNEQWELEFASDVDDRTYKLSQLATVGVPYKGEAGLGGAQGFTITRQLTKTGDSGNDTLASVASGFTVSGESLVNTDRGEVTIVLARDGVTSNYAVMVYSSASLGTLVAQSPAVAANADFTAEAVGGSGLEFSGTMGDSPADAATCVVDFNFASTLNTEGKPDELRIVISLTDEGEGSRLLARMPILAGNGYRLNGVSSAELVDDDTVKANTYVDVYGGSTAA